jgi:hypothetical protein
VDIGVDLVESYLRLNGYLTLTEFEVQRRNESGAFETITEFDIVALRFPGDVYAGDPHGGEDARLLLIEDPVLGLEPDLIDIVIGEVKQGEAELNPGMRVHGALHSVLRRFEWLYDEPLVAVVAALQEHDSHCSPGRGGGTVRTRLVAFGRSQKSDLGTIALSHIVETMLGFFTGLDEAFRPVQFRDPAPALLGLLHKIGFEVKRK